MYLVVDASDIYSQLLQLSGRFALLALSIGLMGLAAVHWLISRTLRPLSELSEAADCIAAGNYSQRVPVISQDEVGVLARNFNRMALAVETHVDTLQEQNERQKLFIGAVTHELKTPLTSLLLNVNTLQSVYLPEEKQAALLESMLFVRACPSFQMDDYARILKKRKATHPLFSQSFEKVHHKTVLAPARASPLSD